MAGPIQKGHAIGALVLGIIEIVCGILVIILSVVAASKATLGANASPYWAGIVFIIPGILGIVTSFTKNNCAMIAFMVLNIIAFVIQGIGAILVGIVVAIWAAVLSEIDNCTRSGINSCYCEYKNTHFTVNGVEDCGELSTVMGILIGVVVFLVIAAIVTLAASILGCVSVCCSNNEQPGTVVMQRQQQQKY